MEIEREKLVDLIGLRLTSIELADDGYIYLYFGAKAIQFLPERLYDKEGNHLDLSGIEDQPP